MKYYNQIQSADLYKYDFSNKKIIRLVVYQDKTPTEITVTVNGRKIRTNQPTKIIRTTRGMYINSLAIEPSFSGLVEIISEEEITVLSNQS